jgi:TatD DNase family protein
MKLKYFDAHTHLNLLGDNWREVGKRALEAGVGFVNVGADEKSSKLALDQVKYLEGVCLPAEARAKVGATVGIHPTCLAETSGEGGSCDFEVIRDLAKDEKVVAIGECGLEYFKLPDFAKGSVVARQRELFIKHIELALEVGKPLMIHCRASQGSTDAYDDTLEILKSYKDQVGDRLRFNFHFFTGDWPTAQKVLDLGGYLSFPGVITFTPLNNDKNLTGQASQ